jgi:hypothetical protein
MTLPAQANLIGFIYSYAWQDVVIVTLLFALRLILFFFHYVGYVDKKHKLEKKQGYDYTRSISFFFYLFESLAIYILGTLYLLASQQVVTTFNAYWVFYNLLPIIVCQTGATCLHILKLYKLTRGKILKIYIPWIAYFGFLVYFLASLASIFFLALQSYDNYAMRVAATISLSCSHVLGVLIIMYLYRLMLEKFTESINSLADNVSTLSMEMFGNTRFILISYESLNFFFILQVLFSVYMYLAQLFLGWNMNMIWLQLYINTTTQLFYCSLYPHITKDRTKNNQ